ncbi:MAG: hypothetical protein DRG36_00975 [Deltaproteobacteria bacterium]|nr:MAG: hypothetical protein DRG36_00975 [Deltaproteobacteria bacterium]RLA97614.1 MAG: hypothetical protein DRG32_03260 [Deltaproteobacteria bacterium]
MWEKAIRIFSIGFPGVFLTLLVLVVFIELMGKIVKAIEKKKD